MGSYTPNHKFYKVDPNELVDVEAQLNYNLRRADERVRSIVEWQRTEADFITEDENLVVGYKWFKTESNSLWVHRIAGEQIVHSSNGKNTTLPYKNPNLLFNSSFNDSFSDFTQELSYCIDTNAQMVRWRGSITFGDHLDFPKNDNTLLFTLRDEAVEVIPARTKYFFVHAGVAGSSYTVARLQFQPTSGEVYGCFMGSDQPTSSQRELSFNDVCYPLNDS